MRQRAHRRVRHAVTTTTSLSELAQAALRANWRGAATAAVGLWRTWRDRLREYYDSRTGAGLAARGFSWSALVADLASA